mmetsp:Transcript_11648/g.23708  ORF Transcript_11648/g.23708 Transcript_11648/m.23708 type:complete len:229 (-) Transcript_11648:1128-1814(-)
MNTSDNHHGDIVINDPPANNPRQDAYPTAIGALIAESAGQMVAAVAHPVDGTLAPSPPHARVAGEHVPPSSVVVVMSSPLERQPLEREGGSERGEVTWDRAPSIIDENSSPRRSRRTRLLIVVSSIATFVVIGLIPTLMDSRKNHRSHTDNTADSPWDAKLLPRDGAEGVSSALPLRFTKMRQSWVRMAMTNMDISAGRRTSLSNETKNRAKSGSREPRLFRATGLRI